MTLSVPERLAQAATWVDASNFQQAEALCRELLDLPPARPHALHILGVSARKQRRFEEAVAFLAESLEIEPKNSGVQFERGVALLEIQRLEEALQHFERTFALNPQFQEACINICSVLERLDRLEEALPWAQRAVEMKPDCAIAHFNLGNCLQATSQVEEAIREFADAARLQSDFDNARWNGSLACLLSGNFSAGWPLYESREAAGKVAIDHYPQPRWQGEPLTNKTVLVHAEQGIGDEILFASCLPDLIAAAKRVVVVCEPRLATLFTRSFPAAKIYGIARRRNGAPAEVAEPIDYQIPAGSLPGFFRKTRESFPQRWKFLHTESAQQQGWRARLDELGSGLKIGISWRAGGQPNERRRRTTTLDQWMPILSAPGVHFVNLQYGDSSEDLLDAKHRLGVTIHDFPDADPLSDLDAFAAKLSALDLVISVGNATVHLAGALGVPAWALLPQVPAWRWMLKGEQSIWYPSVRLFRQSQRRQWEPVFATVATALANRTGRKVTASEIRPLPAARPIASPSPNSALRHPQTLQDVTTTIQSAVDAYQQNDFETAEAICKQILEHAPRDPRALDLRGLTAKARGQFDAAVKYLRLAIEVKPQEVPFHLHLAGTLIQAARHDEAVTAYRRAIELAPDVWSMHFELGGLLRSMQRREDAIVAFQRAIAVDAGNAKAYNALAGVRMELMRWTDAERSLRKALEIKPDYMAAYNNLGQCLQFQGKTEEAIEHYRKALQIDPHCRQAQENLASAEKILLEKSSAQSSNTALQAAQPPDARSIEQLMVSAAKFYNEEKMTDAVRLAEQIAAVDKNNLVALRILGVACRKKKELTRALELLQNVLRLNPQDHAIHFEVAATLTELHRSQEALPHYLKCVELRPTFHPAYVNISAIYEQQERYEEVIAWTRKALAIKPDCALSFYNLANAYRELGNLEAAIDTCRKSIAVNPHYVKAVWNLGLTHLLAGDYEQGWPMFEQRIAMGEVAVDDYSQPRWNGESLQGKTLLIHSEQGIGDEVLFASCYPDAIAMAKKCVVVCDTRLEAIFRRSFPQAIVYGYTRRKDGVGLKLNEDIDLQIPAGSLPLYFRKSKEAFPQRAKFLEPDTAAVAVWKERFAALGPGLKIGISWRAGGKPQERRKRIIPLALWKDILSTPGVQFVNLQYSDSSDEIQQVATDLGIKIHDWEDGDPLFDMDAFGAKVKALDLVISVGNATVHVAGAVGTPTWTLLPMVPSWRWMVRGEQSPWYQSVSLFRQPKRGDWQSVLHQVATRLRSKVQASPPPAKTAAQTAAVHADHWYEAKEIVTEVMIDSLGNSLAEAEEHSSAGRWQQAEELYREVLQIAPRHYLGLHGLGLVARKTGRLEMAIRSFQRSLAIVPQVATHRFNYAGALAEAGRYEEAAAEYLKTLELDPALTLARIELGRVLQKLGNHEEALSQFSRAGQQIAPDPNLLVYRGVSLASQCQLEAAMECFEQALRLQPAHLPALAAMADVYLEDQQYEDAERCLRRALAIEPEAAAWHAQLGRVLQRAGRLEEAIPCLAEAHRLAPQETGYLSELGSLHREVCDFSSAQECLEKALVVQPQSVELLNLLGLALTDRGQFTQALFTFDQALALKPGYANTHLNRAFALLHTGDLAAGWDEYEWRWQAAHAPRRKNSPLPVWQGESLQGKALIVYGEQGLGDEIMFASCYADVLSQAKHVIIVCQPRLEPLFRRAFPSATVVGIVRGQEASWNPPATLAADLQISAASLPRLLRRELTQFPRASFLLPDNAKVAHWREQFAALGNGMKVGISWKAGRTPQDRRQRGETLAAWQPLLATRGALFISLQYGDVQAELEQFAQESGYVIHQGKGADNTVDIDGLAARMAAVDLVITVGNTNAHLAGALGVPAWVLLPPVASWRWLEQQGTSIWYPSARLCRQCRLGDWENLFNRIQHELLNRISAQVEEPKRGVLAPHVRIRSNAMQSNHQML